MCPKLITLTTLLLFTSFVTVTLLFKEPPAPGSLRPSSILAPSAKPSSAPHSEGSEAAPLKASVALPPWRCPEPHFAGVAQACSPSHDAGSCSAAAAAGSRWAALMLEVQRGEAAWPALHADAARRDRAGHPHAYARFDALPLQWPAPQLTRFGGGPEADGSKVLRAPLQRPGEEGPCLVYSFGGNAMVKFEVDLLRREPACRVWQFDCTVANATMARVLAALPADIAQRFTFQPWCVGKDGASMVTKGKGMGRLAGGEDGPYKVALASVATIMGRLGHGGKRLTVLKMDVEGAEHTAIPDMLDGVKHESLLLPRQVSMELHIKNKSTPQPRNYEPVRRLLEAGYVLLWREDNPKCPRCTEVVFQLGCGDAL